MFGFQYYKGKRLNDFPVRMRGGTKRGVWKYSIDNSTVELDNGLIYSAADMQLLYQQKGLDTMLPYRENRARHLAQMDAQYQKEAFGDKEEDNQSGSESS